MLPFLLEQRQKCLNTSHFLMSRFQFYGLRIQLSPLRLAWDASLSRQAATESFLPWVRLQNYFGPFMQDSKTTMDMWISTLDPTTLISHGYVDYIMCSHATNAWYRSKEFELLCIKSHRKEKQGIWEAKSHFLQLPGCFFCMAARRLLYATGVC